MNIHNLYKKFLNHPNICIDTERQNQIVFFLLLKGKNFNGNKFAKEALKKDVNML